MRIISKFKDYYDYLQHMYGIDDKCVYNRTLYSTTNDDDSLVDANLPLDHQYPWHSLLFRLNDLTDHVYKYLIICGYPFVIKIHNNLFYNLTIDDIANLAMHEKNNRYLVSIDRFPIIKQLGHFSEECLNINIKYKTPILVIDNSRQKHTTIVKSSPILGDIDNFVKAYPAEKLYQDISYFILNQGNQSPDLAPPVEVDNKTKIAYHGFDKVSFRPKMR